MAGETTGTSTTGTSPRGTTRDALSSILEPPAANRDQTTTSMTTAAPSVDERPVVPPKRPWITKHVDIFALAGCRYDPEDTLAGASRYWAQCNIEFKGRFHAPYSEAETRRLIGVNAGDQDKLVEQLTVIVADERNDSNRGLSNLRSEWLQYRKATMAVFFAPRVFRPADGAPSSCDDRHPIIYLGLSRSATADLDLAHEFGHLLIAPGHRYLESPLMHPNSTGTGIVDFECLAARGDHAAQARVIQNRVRVEKLDARR